MRNWEISHYNLYFKQWLENMDLEHRQLFPLTYSMCCKNHFYFLSNEIMVAKLVSQEVEGPIGIVIYEETEPKHIHIHSLEIREDFRYKGDGRKMINYFREKNDYIELSSLPESKVFYEKCGLKQQEEGRFIWKRGEGWL